MVENVTPNRNYPEPAAGNPLSFDVGRVVAALRAVDADIAGLIAALAAKAALASPAFEGAPTAPTPTAGDDSNKVATTAFIKAAIDALAAGASYLVPAQNLADLDDPTVARENLDVLSATEVSTAILSAINALKGSATSALDTLVELGEALNNDPDFAATMTAALAAKVAKAGEALSGGFRAVRHPYGTLTTGAINLTFDNGNGGKIDLGAGGGSIVAPAAVANEIATMVVDIVGLAGASGTKVFSGFDAIDGDAMPGANQKGVLSIIRTPEACFGVIKRKP